MGFPLFEVLVMFTVYHKAWNLNQIQAILKICDQSINPPIPASKLDNNVCYASEGCLIIECMLLNI